MSGKIELPYQRCEEGKSLINKFFPKETIKKLYYHATNVRFEDNNEKAEIIKYILGPEFEELGTGTNRIAFLHNGFVVKVALDYRGCVDSFTEYKRSQELPELLAYTYETNFLINIAEYVTVISKEEFLRNEAQIKEVLKKISAGGYIFDDIGFSLKNSYNWGYRDNGDLVILDYGYLYRRPTGTNESAFSCPRCRDELHWNSNYTGFICSNTQCSTKYSIMDVRRRMSLELEDTENQVIEMLNNIKMPKFK